MRSGESPESESPTVPEEFKPGQPVDLSEPYCGVLLSMTTQEVHAERRGDSIIGLVLHFKICNHKPNHSGRVGAGRQVYLLLKK